MLAKMFAGLDAQGLAVPQPYEPTRVMSPLVSGQEYQPDWSIERAYDEALKKSAMVMRCVTGKAEKAASLPLRVFEANEAGRSAAASTHPLNDLLNFPVRDPVEGGREEWISRSIQHHQLAGNALTGITRARDVRQGVSPVPSELTAEDPREVYPVPDELLTVLQWNFRDGDGKALAWERGDLIHWKRHDPSNRSWGCSALQSMALHVDSSVESARTQYIRARRDGRPSMLISDDRIQTAADLYAAEDLVNARQVNRRGGIMLLGGDQKLVAMGMSARDMSIIESMAFDRDMIAIAFGYLPAGFSNDAATYNNSGIFVLHEWSLVQALMQSFCSRLSAFLLSREERRRLYIAPDYSEVQALQDVQSEKLGKLAELAFKGVAVNDLIRGLNLPLPDQEGGDLPLVASGVQPLARVLAAEQGGAV